MSSQRLFNRMTGEAARWLDAPDLLASAAAGWDTPTRQTAQRVLLAQGIAPWMHSALTQSGAERALPADVRDWLTVQHDTNAKRVHCLHDELQGILAAAAERGVRAMPLKGSLLSVFYYASPSLRPMADLDLLIAPGDLEAMRSVLRELGYCARPSDRRKSHFRFDHPLANTVVSMEAEHPDNPRPVEIHTALHASAIGRFPTRDLQARMWQGAQQTTLLGAPIWRPTADALLFTVAAHALQHFARRLGRVLHLLDVAHLLPHADLDALACLAPTDANWCYPILRLAQRALPNRLGSYDFTHLARSVHPRIRRWSENVPLDAACGLVVMSDAPTIKTGTLLGRLDLLYHEWRVAPWRLAVEYGDVPLHIAVGKWFAHALSAGSDKLTRRSHDD